jgi:hypothetical protein
MTLRKICMKMARGEYRRGALNLGGVSVPPGQPMATNALPAGTYRPCPEDIPLTSQHTESPMLFSAFRYSQRCLETAEQAPRQTWRLSACDSSLAYATLNLPPRGVLILDGSCQEVHFKHVTICGMEPILHTHPCAAHGHENVWRPRCGGSAKMA